MGEIIMTAVVQRNGDGFVALCPELSVGGCGGDAAAALDDVRAGVERVFADDPDCRLLWAGSGGDLWNVKFMEFAV